jgi:hypothetical protein
MQLERESASYLYDWKNGPLKEQRVVNFYTLARFEMREERQLAHSGNFMTICLGVHFVHYLVIHSRC